VGFPDSFQKSLSIRCHTIKIGWPKQINDWRQLPYKHIDMKLLYLGLMVITLAVITKDSVGQVRPNTPTGREHPLIFYDQRPERRNIMP
jgi:hypothetical protein